MPFANDNTNSDGEFIPVSSPSATTSSRSMAVNAPPTSVSPSGSGASTPSTYASQRDQTPALEVIVDSNGGVRSSEGLSNAELFGGNVHVPKEGVDGC
ncbi:hypothetical protein IAT38_000234 [Cryptococcus sp. DSM 104549]